MGCCTSLPLPRCLDRFINRRHPNINYDINGMYNGPDSHLFYSAQEMDLSPAMQHRGSIGEVDIQDL